MTQKKMKIKSSNKKQIAADNYSLSSSIVSTIKNRAGKITPLHNPVEEYGRRGSFYPGEYNLAQISLFEDGESYVRQAFQKMTSLMFKEGEVFTGKNQVTIDYIKRRIREIELSSGIPWRELLLVTGKDLISKSNFFWVKVRRQDRSSADHGMNKKNPIAAYFPMPAENVYIKKNKSGKIIKYKQVMPDGRSKEYSPEDIIHFTIDKKPGFDFGTPRLISVIPDIQALRTLEENVEVLFYKTIFPIFQYKVGTESKPAGTVTLPTGEIMDEITYIREQIANMPTEGGIVTPERHEIKYIGAEGQIPPYQGILDYFKQRVLSGLGISSLDIGDAGAANRASAATLSKALIDSVKFFQDCLEIQINYKVIIELLIEADLNIDVLEDRNIVELKFREIDIEEQMKKNVNAQLLFNSDIIDLNEAREETGRQPLRPEQESLMFTERETLKVLAQEFENAKELAKISGSVKTGTINGKADRSKSQKAANSSRNINAPSNQYGRNTGPQKSTQDRLIENERRLIKSYKDLKDTDPLVLESLIAGSIKRLEKKGERLGFSYDSARLKEDFINL